MTATLSACRWDWCTQTFPDQSALRDHVELEHIGQAIPVKRKDVPLLRCVEDGASMPGSSAILSSHLFIADLCRIFPFKRFGLGRRFTLTGHFPAALHPTRNHDRANSLIRA